MTMIQISLLRDVHRKGAIITNNHKRRCFLCIDGCEKEGRCVESGNGHLELGSLAFITGFHRHALLVIDGESTREGPSWKRSAELKNAMGDCFLEMNQCSTACWENIIKGPIDGMKNEWEGRLIPDHVFWLENEGFDIMCNGRGRETELELDWFGYIVISN